MSGLEWASLALSIADVVHTLTVYLIDGFNDTANYGGDLETARLSLSAQATTFREIKTLLFGPDGSRDQGVFSEFDAQTQLDIINILRHFRESLELQYSLVNKRNGATAPSIESVLDPTVGLGSHHSGTVFRRLRWGFREKSKVDKVIRELDCWNGRLVLIVKLKLISTERAARHERPGAAQTRQPSALLNQIRRTDVLGNRDPLGLERDLELANLSLDPPSLIQGVGGLQLTERSEIFAYEKAKDIMQPTQQSRSHSPSWGRASPAQPARVRRRLVDVHGQVVLLEYKPFVADEDGEPPQASHERIKQLAKILNESKPERYRTLQCSVYYCFEEHFVLAFPISSSLNPRYTTLAEILDRYKGQPPSLDDRFVLARKLCAAVAQLHTIGWVHKSIRSDNILFFNAPASDLLSIPSSSSRQATATPDPDLFQSLYLSGWEYSRPETGLSSVRSGSEDIEENIYRHPDQWGLPTVRFNRSHDVHSLGVILLEISRWKRAVTFHPSRFRNCELGSVVRDYFVQEAASTKTSGSMGRRYQEIVLKCLQGTLNASVDDGSPVISGGDVSLPALNVEFEDEAFHHEVLEVLDEIVLHL
ncbi:hypothetical protein ACJ41O_000080 [Fusarium nematophilum]